MPTCFMKSSCYYPILTQSKYSQRSCKHAEGSVTLPVVTNRLQVSHNTQDTTAKPLSSCYYCQHQRFFCKTEEVRCVCEGQTTYAFYKYPSHSLLISNRVAICPGLHFPGQSNFTRPGVLPAHSCPAPTGLCVCGGNS